MATTSSDAPGAGSVLALCTIRRAAQLSVDQPVLNPLPRLDLSARLGILGR